MQTGGKCRRLACHRLGPSSTPEARTEPGTTSSCRVPSSRPWHNAIESIRQRLKGTRNATPHLLQDHFASCLCCQPGGGIAQQPHS